MAIYKWAGGLLYRNGGLATSADCCCGGGTCCGRNLPTEGGFNAWPSTLYAHITPVNCPCLTGFTLPLVWNATDSVWEGSQTVSCPGGSGDTFTLRVACGNLPDQPWVASLSWSPVCVDSIGNSSIVFDLTGSCDPLDVSGEAETHGIGCCGISAGSGIIGVQVTE